MTDGIPCASRRREAERGGGVTDVVAAKSGLQWTIEAEGHRAVIAEVGGVLRGYSVGEREVVDGFGPDEISPASALARSWRRGPTASATGTTRSRARPTSLR
nr:hypothetical protein GCM10020092_103820 [Actinoplanes digitatis]